MYKHQDLRFDPQHPCKKLGVLTHTLETPVLEGWRQKDAQNSPDIEPRPQQAPNPSERPHLIMGPEVELWLPHAFMCVHVCVCIYT